LDDGWYLAGDVNHNLPRPGMRQALQILFTLATPANVPNTTQLRRWFVVENRNVESAPREVFDEQPAQVPRSSKQQ